MKSMMMVAAAVLAGVALAQGPEMNPRSFEPIGGRSPSANDPLVRLVSNSKVAEKIGLKTEQIATIKEITKEQRKVDRDLRDKMRAAMRKQTDLLQAEKVDEAAVMAAIDELFEVRKEMAKNQTRQVIRVKAVLTPEQIAAAKEELTRGRQKRKAHHANRPMPPSAPKGEQPEADAGDAKGESKE